MTTSTPKPGRIAWVDTGRGIAISFVVLFHTANWLLAAGFPVQWWIETNAVLATIRLPMFFVISGLFAGKWMTARWSALWQTKLSLFVWVYVVWSVIATFTFMAGLAMKGQGGNPLGQIRGALAFVWDPRFELWFIWALALFFTGAKLLRRVPVVLQLIVTGIASVIALSGYVHINTGWEGVMKYFFFFLAGMHARTFFFWWARTVPWYGSLGLILGAGVVAFLGVHLQWDALPGYYFVACVAGALAGVLISRALSRLRFLGRIGQRTLPVYLTHTSVIILVCWALSYLPDPAKSLPVALVLPPLLAATAIVASLALSSFVSRRRVVRHLYEQPGWFADLAVRERRQAS